MTFSFTPSMSSGLFSAVMLLFITMEVNAHIAAWHPAMYCLEGNIAGVNNLNSNDAVNPLWNLTKNDWWMHAYNGCDQFPPPAGVFLNIPAGGVVIAELATNRAFTSTIPNPLPPGDFPDGQNHTGLGDSGQCITNPNIHTTNETMAAGTAFAISYVNDIKAVTLDNLVVFSVAYNTPWKRIANYEVPQDLEACPEGGCICVWTWIPNGCGEPNMYMEAIRCNVTNVSPTARPLASPKAPVWCQDDPSKCVTGAKQMMAWNQLEYDNIGVKGLDLSGMPKSPAYNAKCGFQNGAQNDIFESSTC